MIYKHWLMALMATNTVLAAPQASLAVLESCAKDALSSMGDVDLRMQTSKKPTYEDARVGAVINPEFPALITFAKTAKEVQSLLKCALSNGYQPVPRSGRHHFEGWSALNGSMVIDVSSIKYVHVAKDLNSVTMGGGNNLGEIYSKLSAVGKTFLGGICPTVAIGGYLGVGGYNVQQRALGMAMDQILSFKMVTADGSLLNVSPNEHPDLFWAGRGGGVYGIVVEVTAMIHSLPRSAMVEGWFDRSSRLDVIKTWINWAPVQPAAFTSQMNVYSNRTQLIGYYLGGTTEDLKKLMKSSGLMDIPNNTLSITGDCSTENSRMFWDSSWDKPSCISDQKALEHFYGFYNVQPIYLSPIEPALRIDKQHALPFVDPAVYWQRFSSISKTYFTVKSRPLSDKNIEEFVRRTGELADSRDFWGEWTAFGIPNASTTSSFAWIKDATLLMRMELPSDSDVYEENEKWALDFDNWFRPVVGNASYSGYIDATINTNPLTAYYGDNICGLIKVKKAYDPDNVFRNPFSVPTTPPKGLC